MRTRGPRWDGYSLVTTVSSRETVDAHAAALAFRPCRVISNQPPVSMSIAAGPGRRDSEPSGGARATRRTSIVRSCLTPAGVLPSFHYNPKEIA